MIAHGISHQAQDHRLWQDLFVAGEVVVTAMLEIAPPPAVPGTEFFVA